MVGTDPTVEHDMSVLRTSDTGVGAHDWGPASVIGVNRVAFHGYPHVLDSIRGTVVDVRTTEESPSNVLRVATFAANRATAPVVTRVPLGEILPRGANCRPTLGGFDGRETHWASNRDRRPEGVDAWPGRAHRPKRLARERRPGNDERVPGAVTAGTDAVARAGSGPWWPRSTPGLPTKTTMGNNPLTFAV